MKNQKGISTLTGIVIIVLVAVVLVGGVFAYQYLATQKADSQLLNEQQNQNQQQQTENQQTNNVQPVDETAYMTRQFVCDNDKYITASYYESDNNRRVDLELSDGRKLSLSNIYSASGDKYANTNESIIFWSKGAYIEGEGTAFILEKTVQTYFNCKN